MASFAGSLTACGLNLPLPKYGGIAPIAPNPQTRDATDHGWTPRVAANIVLVTLIGMFGTQVFWGANPRAPIGG